MAPTEGRPKSRIGWLLCQLPETWPDSHIEVWYPYVRKSTPSTLEQARTKPEDLLCQADVKRDPRSFTVTLSRPMGQKRGRAEGSFVRETREQTVTFYRDLVQNMKAWQARLHRSVLRSQTLTTAILPSGRDTGIPEERGDCSSRAISECSPVSLDEGVAPSSSMRRETAFDLRTAERVLVTDRPAAFSMFTEAQSSWSSPPSKSFPPLRALVREPGSTTRHTAVLQSCGPCHPGWLAG